MRDNCNLTYNQILKLILLKSHPVHSYFSIADSSFDPNIEFGGTWILLPEGTILMCSSSAGGDNILKAENIPSLTISESDKVLTGSISGMRLAWGADASLSGILKDKTTTYTTGPQTSGSTNLLSGFSIDATHNHSYTNNNVKDLSNVIKHVKCFIWYRTA